MATIPTSSNTTSAKKKKDESLKSYQNISSNKPKEYTNPYSTQISDLLNSIQSSKFNYNFNADPLYNQYKEQYQRQGQKAMMDTVGNVSALTGGYGNSYATTAGSEAYQGYMQELNNKIPELYELAYNKHNNDLNNNYNLLNAYGNERDFGYGQHRDSVSDWQYDNEFAYGQYRDDTSDYQFNTNFDYDKYRDTVGDSQWEKEYNLAKKNSSSSSSSSGGSGGSSKKSYSSNKKSSSSGGSSGSTKTSTPVKKTTTPDTSTIKQKMISIGIKSGRTAAYNYLKANKKYLSDDYYQSYLSHINMRFK
jgi:hypothetical protein